MSRSFFLLTAAGLSLTALTACKGKDGAPTGTAKPTTTERPTADPATSGPPTVEQATAFVADTDKGLRATWEKQARADWINSTYLTEDTDALAADAQQATMEYLTGAIKAAARYKDLAGVPPDAARQLELLRRSATLPSPSDPAKRKELAELAVGMQSAYGKGKYCSKSLAAWATDDAKKEAGAEGAPCLSLTELEKILRDPKATYDQLAEAYTGWRTISPPLRADYERFVALGNEGAKEIGFTDVGDVWKSRYDMPTDALEADVERLWGQVKPLYDKLHCYVRKQLRKKWGDQVAATGPIPAHLFGNMWSQQWGNIYPLVEPYPGQPSTDVTKAMEKKKLDALQMTKIAENFFVSLGMPKLPDTFWSRSMITKPRDREVVCHASAWPVTFSGDVRIKMCTQVTDEDLETLHHELGHIYYFMAQTELPVLFQDGANDGFHEAIGDVLALSMTPAYLAKVGILDASATATNDKAEINLLMRRALDKVAFLPFGLLIDKWRWDVFAGKTPPDKYNQAWWDLVLRYQGIAPPTPRGEDMFDPGAKYHVPANTPYLRYFLAHIYQFQFHRALCKAAGHQGPLHTCSIFESKEAGERLWKTLGMGASKPWPEAMATLTGGESQADASALIEYFAPLQTFLDEQTKGEQCGW